MFRPTPFIITPASELPKQYPNLRIMAEHIGQDYLRHLRVEECRLRAMGTALWDALQLANTLEIAKNAAGQHVLPIVIESDAGAILALPWETLHHPRYGFLGREPGFTLSRRNPAVNVSLPNVSCEPLRVLLFTSLPDDLSEYERLDVEAEQAAIQEALLDQERQGEIVLEVPDDGRFTTFRSALQQFQPHLVYLSGHGNFTHEPHHQRAYGSFLFEDEQGQGQILSENQLISCFQNTGVQLLVLSACMSAKQHPHYPANGLSAALSRAGIPHVIGMRESVIDDAATRFATILLRALGQRATVDVALQQARTVMGYSHGPGGYREIRDPQRTAVAAGQWSLPQLLSYQHDRGLVEWCFIPKPVERKPWQILRGEVSLPERFVGRRRELRRWQYQLRSKALNCLLITGAGGMGKTALAGKLLATLENDGYCVFTFSLQHDWRNGLLEMELALAEDEILYKKYQLIQNKGLDEEKRVEYILKFLLEKCGGKLALFFDNLEPMQDAHNPHALTDATLQCWLDAARRLTQQGLKLIMTSRWRLPDWADAEHYALGRPVYGDYVALVRLHQLPLSGKRLENAYLTLGGNFRALEFFAEAVNHMPLKEEEDFLTALGQAESKAQIDMALAKVMARRSEREIALLHRLLAYQTVVTLDGVEAVCEVTGENIVFANGEAESILPRLLAVSLVEQFKGAMQTTYQLAPLVRSWLQKNGAPEPSQPLLQAAAEFLLWQLESRLNTGWEHRLATHAALLAAHLTERGHQVVLDWIVEPLNRAGSYRTLLNDWLSPLVKADNLRIRGLSRSKFHRMGAVGAIIS